jgi:SsrA-binding protein
MNLVDMTKKKWKSNNIANNKKARHDYEIISTLEVGISLVGSEVKSLRAGRASIAESYVSFEQGEAWLMKAHIPPYLQAGPLNHEPERRRRLLMKKKEIATWRRKAEEKGFTIIPLRLYFNGSWIKMEIGCGKGRKKYDKRQKLKEQTDKRDMARALRNRD